MGYLRAPLYPDIILAATMIILFEALGGVDSMISLLPIILILGVASGPIFLFISWVCGSFWNQ